MVDNRSPYTHAWFRKRGPAAQDFDVLVARACYRIDTANQTLTFEPGCELQPGDVLGGDPLGDPYGAVLAREGDLLVFKPSTDIHVIGTAQAPEAKPAPSWLAGIRVGDCEKLVKFWGPRRFRMRLLGWSLSEPEPIDALPLSYRLSFGGHFASTSDPTVCLSKQDNPAGCGWLPRAERLRALPRVAREELQARVLQISELAAPQIEDPNLPVRSPEHEQPTVGLGPIARHWSPRIDYLGTRDAAWRATEFPAYPDDFSPEFFQSAAPGLTTQSYLRGGEPIVLAGLFPEGRLQLSVPHEQPIAVVVRNDARQQVAPLVLDTVQIDLDTRLLHLTWRTSFACSNRVRHLTLVKDGRA